MLSVQEVQRSSAIPSATRTSSSVTKPVQTTPSIPSTTPATVVKVTNTQTTGTITGGTPTDKQLFGKGNFISEPVTQVLVILILDYYFYLFFGGGRIGVKGIISDEIKIWNRWLSEYGISYFHGLKYKCIIYFLICIVPAKTIQTYSASFTCP